MKQYIKRERKNIDENIFSARQSGDLCDKSTLNAQVYMRS